MKWRLAIVSPFPPPFGGMSVLAQTMQRCLENRDIEIIQINTHPARGGLLLKNRFTKKAYETFIYLFSLRNVIKADFVLVISSSGNFFYIKALPALIAGKIFKKPVILDFVGGGIVDKLNNGNSLLGYCLKRFDSVVVPTPTFEKVFGAARVPCILFPHIVDIERFSNRKVKSSVPILFAAKNLVESSGIRTLILAYAEIKKKFPEAQFLIAGDGPERVNLQRLLLELNLTGVEFLGNVGYDEMPSLFERASIFVHGAKYESFGIVLVEALASGTPVVSTNVGGIPDIIKNGINGYLVEYEDYLSLAARIVKLIEDETVFNKFVENGFQTAASFSGENLAPKFIEILESFSSTTGRKIV